MAFRSSDWPETPTVCSTPGVSRASASIRAMTRWVRSTEAESGSCTLRTDSPCLAAGMKPVGRMVELPVGQHQQAAVGDQHEHADPEHMADDPAVDVGHPVEEAVEAPEEPAQHGVHRPDDDQPDRRRRPALRGRSRRP